jgi:hypothetical protein
MQREYFGQHEPSGGGHGALHENAEKQQKKAHNYAFGISGW